MLTNELLVHVLCYLEGKRSKSEGGYGYVIQRSLEERLGVTVRYQDVYKVLQSLKRRELVDVRIADQDEPSELSLAGVPRKYYFLNALGSRAREDACEAAICDLEARRSRIEMSIALMKRLMSEARLGAAKQSDGL